jgi:hypothetical protein
MVCLGNTCMDTLHKGGNGNNNNNNNYYYYYYYLRADTTTKWPTTHIALHTSTNSIGQSPGHEHKRNKQQR